MRISSWLKEFILATQHFVSIPQGIMTGEYIGLATFNTFSTEKHIYETIILDIWRVNCEKHYMNTKYENRVCSWFSPNANINLMLHNQICLPRLYKYHLYNKT